MTKYDKFKLDDEHIEFIVSKIKNKHEYITSIGIEKSPNRYSNSFYLRVYNKGSCVSLRISDHDTKLTSQGGGINNIVVGKSTTNNRVIKYIEEHLLPKLNTKTRAVNLTNLFKNI